VALVAQAHHQEQGLLPMVVLEEILQYLGLHLSLQLHLTAVDMALEEIIQPLLIMAATVVLAVVEVALVLL
jgi:hypothetical protein